MHLDEFQTAANRTDQRPRKDKGDEQALVFPLVGLSSEVGSLMTQYKKRIRDGDAHPLFTDRAAEDLGDIMWYVANLSAKLGLSLEEIAERNLQRITNRWPVDGSIQPLPLLDDDFPPEEQLPRQATVTFQELDVDGAVKVKAFSEGEQVGNDLTDMAHDPDGYRYHDAFHLTYAALLGWSPVARSLFRCKRASNPKVREVEDGGRAVVIEEGIAAFVFEYARQQNFLEGVRQLDFELLRTVLSMVSRLEVRERTYAMWERAILRSFEIWRALRDNRGGILELDLLARTIEVRPA